MRILVTGADGFVGGRLVPRLVAAGHAVTAAVRQGTQRRPAGVPVVELELRDPRSVDQMLTQRFDGVMHLAAVASGADARRDPGAAWEINAAGTARIGEALGRHAVGAAPPILVLVSTGEVYGAGPWDAPRRESDPTQPCSPYAASKLGAEIAAQEAGRRLGLRVIIARSFPHTGAGQDPRFVVPAFARRIREAMSRGEASVPVGNLEPVRDFLHVADVVDAYALLLERGRPGRVYNVASGAGVAIGDIFERLRMHLGARVDPVPDAALVRAADIPHLVGDASRLRADTGWRPQRTLDEALDEVVRAEAD